jgi:hypothetical protein
LLLQNCPTRPESTSGATSDQKLFKLTKMIERADLADLASRQCFCRSVFAQPRPISDIRDTAAKRKAPVDAGAFKISF